MKVSDDDRKVLEREVAGLPSQFETDDVDSRRFDLMALQMQLELAEADHAAFEVRRQKLAEIAATSSTRIRSGSTSRVARPG